jgi:hypothetical protein
MVTAPCRRDASSCHEEERFMSQNADRSASSNGGTNDTTATARRSEPRVGNQAVWREAGSKCSNRV